MKLYLILQCNLKLKIMKYMGSKRRISKEILEIMLKNRTENQYYVEPFMGGCNVICEVKGNRIGNDYNEYISAMWNEMVYNNWQPPTLVTEEEYVHIKNNKNLYPKHLVGFVGVALTFGSTWFGTYARNKRGTNYALEGRKNLLKQIENLKGVEFNSLSYSEINMPKNSIIYCDPPYKNTTGYKDKFSHDDFYKWCKEMKEQGHTIFISEYEMPKEFKEVWSKELPTNLNARYKNKPIEKLFTL